MISTNVIRNPLGSLACLIGILILVIFCAWPGMRAPLFTDDIYQLEKISYYTHWSGVFKPDAFGFYRPVKNTLFLLASPLSKNLMAWHWVGLIAYLGATVGIYRIASICLESRWLALLATFFWAFSPSCVSTAIWVSCANISIGLIFAACVFHFHEHLAKKPSIASLFSCAFFFALALLCYESMIAIPALLIIRDLQQRRLALNRQCVIRYGAYTLVAVAFMVVRAVYSSKGIASHEIHPGFAPGITPLQLSLSAPWFLWRHFLMWIFPFGTLEALGSYAWLRSASVAGLVFGWLFLASLLTASAMMWKKLPVVSYGILFFVIASIPAGNFIPNFNGPINDAYVTIPSIGLAIAFAGCCGLLIEQLVKIRRHGEASGIAIVAVLSVFLLYRMPVCAAYFRYWAKVWSDPVEMMLLVSETRPFQFEPKAYASTLLFTSGYIDQAGIMAKEVIQAAPWSTTAKLTLARISAYHQDYPAAEEYYRTIMNSDIAPLFKDPAQLELAQLISRNPARHEEATGYLRAFLQSNRGGKHPEAVAMLAGIYQQKGDQKKAVATLERGLSIHPANPILMKMLASMTHPVPVKDARGN